MSRKKNIVLVMYNFPPIGAGRGIAWTFFLDKISHYFNVDVITINPSKNDPIYNESKLQMISENYNVHRTHTDNLYNLMYHNKNSNYTSYADKKKSVKSKIFRVVSRMYKKIIRSYIFPDRMVFWNKYAYKEFKNIYNEKHVDLVITVGFPFSTHILGKKIKKNFGTKLILDYGDPWSFNPSNETVPKWRRFIDYIIEKNIVYHADYVTVTTKKTEEKFKKIFKIDNITVVPQGVDTKKYTDEILNKKNSFDNRNKITLFYSGIFYEDIRNPIEFFKGVSLLKESNLRNKQIEIIIAGKMESYIFDLVEKLQFNENINIKFLGNIPFNDVIKEQIKSNYLLYFGNKGELQVPGKLYEYIAARRPIFAIAPVHDEACDIIENLNRGIIVKDNAIEIKNAFERIVTEADCNERYFNLEEINDYDWNVISDKYIGILDNILRGE